MSSSLRRIVVLDITCPKPYDLNTLQTEPLGGSEATVIRVAEALAATGRYEVIVAQHNRTELGVGLATYVGLDHLDQIQQAPHAVLAFRDVKLVPFVRKLWGHDPKLFLWMEDFNHQEVVQAFEIVSEDKVKIIGCSRTHKSIITDAILRQVKDTKGVTASFVYNPIDLQPDETSIDPDKFVFFSSPHKGLDLTLTQFERLRQHLPNAKLYVANPGYIADKDSLPSYVVNLGSLPHSKVIEHVRSAYCVFHMNAVFPETFGIVHAEAAAVGTPVLTSYFGANYEIVGDREQLVDVKDEKEVIERILKWKANGRPTTKANPEFKLAAVIAKWEELFNA